MGPAHGIPLCDKAFGRFSSGVATAGGVIRVPHHRPGDGLLVLEHINEFFEAVPLLLDAGGTLQIPADACGERYDLIPGLIANLGELLFDSAFTVTPLPVSQFLEDYTPIFFSGFNLLTQCFDFILCSGDRPLFLFSCRAKKYANYQVCEGTGG